MTQHDEIGFVFFLNPTTYTLYPVIFTYHKRAYVYFTQFEIGFVFDFFLTPPRFVSPAAATCVAKRSGKRSETVGVNILIS